MTTAILTLSATLQHLRDAYAATTPEHTNLFHMLCPRIQDSSVGKIASPPDARQISIDYAVSKQVFRVLYYMSEYCFWESSASLWAVDIGDGILLIDAVYADSVGLVEDDF